MDGLGGRGVDVLGFLWLEPLGPLGSLIEELGLIDLLLEVAACGITF